MLYVILESLENIQKKKKKKIKNKKQKGKRRKNSKKKQQQKNQNQNKQTNEKKSKFGSQYNWSINPMNLYSYLSIRVFHNI